MEAEAFGRYLLGHGEDIAHLSDVVELELAVLRAESSGTAQQVLLSCDPLELLNALAAGALPPGGDSHRPGGDSHRYEVVVPAP